MKIEEGKYYKRVDGKIVGPGIVSGLKDEFIVLDGHFYMRHAELTGTRYGPLDLVEEVPSPNVPEPPCDGKPAAELGPVRTVTRKEIINGHYGHFGRLNVINAGVGQCAIAIKTGIVNAAQARELARLLTEIADAMEEAKP